MSCVRTVPYTRVYSRVIGNMKGVNPTSDCVSIKPMTGDEGEQESNGLMGLISTESMNKFSLESNQLGNVLIGWRIY